MADSPSILYTTLPTSLEPLGDLLLAATGTGLVRVAFAVEDHDEVLSSLAQYLDMRAVPADARAIDAADAPDAQTPVGAPTDGATHLRAARDQLSEYFAGTRTVFDLALDHALSSGFRTRVQALLPEIPYGSTASYGDLALRAGSPDAVRAVGTACATNPLPIVLPCHRVLRSDGALGGYIGGMEAKRALLEFEGALPADARP